MYTYKIIPKNYPSNMSNERLSSSQKIEREKNQFAPSNFGLNKLKSSNFCKEKLI